MSFEGPFDDFFDLNRDGEVDFLERAIEFDLLTGGALTGWDEDDREFENRRHPGYDEDEDEDEDYHVIGWRTSPVTTFSAAASKDTLATARVQSKDDYGFFTELRCALEGVTEEEAARFRDRAHKAILEEDHKQSEFFYKLIFESFPNDWEAFFFTGYYRIKGEYKKEIRNAAGDLRSILYQAFGLLREQEKDAAERLGAVRYTAELSMKLLEEMSKEILPQYIKNRKEEHAEVLCLQRCLACVTSAMSVANLVLREYKADDKPDTFCAEMLRSAAGLNAYLCGSFVVLWPKICEEMFRPMYDEACDALRSISPGTEAVPFVREKPVRISAGGRSYRVISLKEKPAGRQKEGEQSVTYTLAGYYHLPSGEKREIPPRSFRAGELKTFKLKWRPVMHLMDRAVRRSGK